MKARFTGRIHERQFWLVQLGVGVATALHFAVEIGGLSDHDGGIGLALHHLPIVLYLFPVTYAGITYGLEGGFFTGLWSAALVIPTLFVWHRNDFDWLGELFFVLVVVSVGLLAARPVERERRQRHETEAIAQRLALVNELATRLGESALPHALSPTIDQLIDTMDLAGAAIQAKAAGGESFEISRGTPDGSSPSASVSLASGDEDDRLLVFTKSGQRLDADDLRFLDTVAAEIGVVLTRVTQRERERLQLERYARNVTHAQEEERRRIARDLHDDAAQALVVLGQRLDELVAEWRDRAAPTAALEGLRTLTDEVLTSVRGYSRELRPTILDDLGLVPALEWLLDEVGSRAGLEGEVVVEGIRSRLPSDTELALFRIAQEALHNVERHADAANVTISVTFDDTGVRLDVTDDGVGFVAGEAPSVADGGPGAGLGLLGMRERAQLAGGTLVIRSRPGEGTRVSTEFPVEGGDGATGHEE